MIKRRLTIKWFRPMMAGCAKVKALQQSSKTWAHPEYWFEPLFDKTQSVLDAEGGPQDLITALQAVINH